MCWGAEFIAIFLQITILILKSMIGAFGLRFFKDFYCFKDSYDLNLFVLFYFLAQV